MFATRVGLPDFSREAERLPAAGAPPHTGEAMVVERAPASGTRGASDHLRRGALGRERAKPWCRYTGVAAALCENRSRDARPRRCPTPAGAVPGAVDHRPHRPRQEHARRPDPRAVRRRRPPRHARAVPRHDGPRAGAGHHDQGPERAPHLAGPRPAPDRHARPRRLRLRGLAQPRGLRGRDPARRRQPGHRGPDARQLLRGARRRPHDRRRAQQDRPAPGRARQAGRGDRAGARHPGHRGAPDLGQDRRGRARAARRGGRPRPAAQGRSRRTAPGADLRLVLRRLPRGDQCGAGLRRHARERRPPPLPAGRAEPRRRGGRRPPAGPDAGGVARPGRGRLPDRRHQGRRRGAGRRDGHDRGASGHRAARLPRSEADGVLRAVPGRRRRVRRSPRGAREATTQRLVVHLRARDVGCARLRVPLRVPRPVAHGDRARAPRARVRPLARRDRAERRVRRAPVRPAPTRSSTTRRPCRRRTRSSGSRSRTSR